MCLAITSMWASTLMFSKSNKGMNTSFTSTTIYVFLDNWPVSVFSFVTCMEGYTPQISRLAQAIGCFLPFHHAQCVGMSSTSTIKLLFLTPTYYSYYLHRTIPCVTGEVSLSSSSLSAGLDLALLVFFVDRWDLNVKIIHQIN